MNDPMFAVLVFLQVAVFIALVILAIRLVKVIKSQNDGKLISPATMKRIRRKGGGPRT